MTCYCGARGTSRVPTPTDDWVCTAHAVEFWQGVLEANRDREPEVVEVEVGARISRVVRQATAFTFVICARPVAA